MMIRQLAILFGCLALGELLIYFTGIPLPSSIVGMLLLTLSLQLRVIRLEWVQTLADFLVANIGFFFVPPGVAIMCHFKLIKAEWLPIGHFDCVGAGRDRLGAPTLWQGYSQ